MNKFKKYIIVLILLIFTYFNCYSQSVPIGKSDSGKKDLSNFHFLDSLKPRNIFKTTYVAAPFIFAGTVLFNPAKRFQNLRNEFAPNFNNTASDYFQYVPTLALYGIKISGVKGRSSWKRVVTTNAISAVIMSALVNGIKYTVQETRPYGSDNNSFPSGHTALAFMSANMIHHEYGLTRSPWYSIGAYSVATATAIMRVLNNQHYIHDVAMGAGIGILSTELGYLLSDIIFKGSGILLSNKNFGDFSNGNPSSSMELTIGFNKLLNNIPITSSVILKSSWGSTSGIEGTYYLHRNGGNGSNGSNSSNYGNGGSLGIGVNASVSTATTKVIRGSFSFTGPSLAWYNIGIFCINSWAKWDFCELPYSASNWS